ncbi:MAG: hypothetical protein AAF385_11370 [Pseudomonadota bacterium]
MRTQSLAVLAIVAIWPAVQAAEVDVRSALSECRHISDESERLSCYDAIEHALSEQTSNANNEALSQLGAEQLPGNSEQARRDNPPVNANVTRCTRGSNKKLYFYLENGQVWRQKSDRRLRIKACEFNVEISKDFFGYIMKHIDEDVRIRVSRVR